MGAPWSWQLHCRAWVFLSSCSRSGQQSQNPPAILFPTRFENRTRQPASCAQEVTAGHCHTQCTKKSRCRESKEHALTLTAAPVDINRAAGEASLRGQSPGRGQSPSRLKTTTTRTFKMPCWRCTQGALIVGVADDSCLSAAGSVRPGHGAVGKPFGDTGTAACQSQWGGKGWWY